MSNILSKEIIYESWDTSARDLPWLLIDHFSPIEFNSHIDEISGAIVLALDTFREKLHKKVFISPATWGEHSKKSWHKIIPGRNNYIQAIDVFPECNLAYAFMTSIKTRIFGGIGIYPYWKWSDKKLVGGLHLDTRNTSDLKIWWQDQNNIYHYLKTWKDIYSLFTTLLES